MGSSWARGGRRVLGRKLLVELNGGGGRVSTGRHRERTPTGISEE